MEIYAEWTTIEQMTDLNGSHFYVASLCNSDMMRGDGDIKNLRGTYTLAHCERMYDVHMEIQMQKERAEWAKKQRAHR